MPGSFLPFLGIVGSIIAMGALNKPPKAPDPPRIPKAPDPAPLPKSPEPPKKEPTINPEDAKAQTRESVNRRKRLSSQALDQPLEEDTGNASVKYKSLLGE